MDVNTTMSPDEALDAARQAATDYECATSMSQESDAAERLLHAFRVLDATLVHNRDDRPSAWNMPPVLLAREAPAAEPAARFEVCPTMSPGLHAIWDTVLGDHVSDSIGDAVLAGITVFRTEENAQRVADRLNADQTSVGARDPQTDYDVEFFAEENARRLPVAASVDALPATVEAIPLPVYCWVHSTGLYVMETQGEWRLVRPLSAERGMKRVAKPAPEVVHP